MARFRSDLNGKGVEAILTSDSVRAHLTQMAERVRVRADASGGGIKHRIIQDTSPGRGMTRARAAVRVAAREYKALVKEADTGYLSGSIGGAL